MKQLNNLKLAKRRNEVRRKYRTPQNSNKAREVNAIHINPTNSLGHELMKFLIGYCLSSGNELSDTAIKALKIEVNNCSALFNELKKDKLIERIERKQFITEAENVDTGNRHDLICIDNEQIYEIVYRNSNPKLYKKVGAVVINLTKL